MSVIATDSTAEHARISPEVPPANPAISISLLGHFSATCGPKVVDVRGLKQRALLAYLALSPTGTETRERMVGLLWSESDEERARGSLRQTLRSLRQAFGDVGFDGLKTDNFAIAIDRQGVGVDVAEILADLEQRRVHPQLLNTVRVTETLLVGFEDADPAFRAWLLARRQALHDRLTRSLEAGLQDTTLGSETRIRFAEALMNLDPTHEESCRFIMRTRAQGGDVTGALRVYRTLWNLLDEEYDMEPSAQTQRLVADIKTGNLPVVEAEPPPPPAVRAEPMPVAPAPPATGTLGTTKPVRPVRLLLMVEPPSSEGIPADRLHILDGFRHHLISCLVRFREWQVSEATAPKATVEGAPGASRYRIQVTAYPSGDALSLILSLKDEETEHFVWSDRLQLRADNMFEVQQRIVQRITVALNVQLSTDRLTRLAGQPNLSPELYDRWLVAQELAVVKRKPADWERAADILRDLIREAPAFGPAHSTLAQLRNVEHIVHPGIFRSEKGQQEALDLAKTAVQLDPVDSRSHLCLGWAYSFADLHDQALIHLGLACDLNDADPWTLTSAAHGHAFAGEFERSRQLAEMARDVSLVPSPMHWAYSAIMCFMWGDYEGCIDAADRSKDIAPVTPMWRAAAFHQLGRGLEAKHEAQRFLNFARSQWAGATPPGDDRVGEWIAQLFPIRDPADRLRLLRALAGAGLPVAVARED